MDVEKAVDLQEARGQSAKPIADIESQNYGRSFWLYLREIWRRKELIYYLSVGEIKRTYSEFILGYLWWILNPLLWMFVYWIVLDKIFKAHVPHYPLFLMCGILPWRAFSIAMNRGVSVFKQFRGLIQQIPFPKVVLITSITFSEMFMIIPGMLLLVVSLPFFHVSPSIYLFQLPLILLVQTLFVLSLNCFLSVFGAYFGDIKNIVQALVRVLLYFSPVLYSLSRLPEELRYVLSFNPVAPIFIGYKNVMLYHKSAPLLWLSGVTAFSIFLLLFGLMLLIASDKKVAKLL